MTKENNIEYYLEFIGTYLKNNGLRSIDDYVKDVVFESRYDSRKIELIKNLLQWMIPVEHRKIILEEMINKYFGESSEFYFDQFYCSTSDLNEMISAGNVIGGHSVNHGWMGKCSIVEQELEITGSTELLECLTKQKHKSFSYPFGSYNDESMRLLKMHNYKVSFTTAVNSWKPSIETCLEIPRLDTNDFPPIA